MIRRLLLTPLILVFCNPVWSFNCYLTLAKDSCWTNYNVSVDVIDATTSKKITTIEVPSGTFWTRVVFSCTPAQKLNYTAQYSPVFWQSEAGKIHPALKSWSLPGAVNPGDSAWTIPLCFSADFSEVPLPPEAKGNCKCDFTQIPPPKLQ